MTNEPEWMEEKVKEWLSKGNAKEWPEVVVFIEKEISIAKAELLSKIEWEVEAMKTYTGGSSVNKKDYRVNKEAVKEILSKYKTL